MSTRRVRSVRQVAAAVGCDADRAIELLDELKERGLAERCEGGWRMTEDAERRFGQVLRDVDMEPEAA